MDFTIYYMPCMLNAHSVCYVCRVKCWIWNSCRFSSEHSSNRRLSFSRQNFVWLKLCVYGNGNALYAHHTHKHNQIFTTIRVWECMRQRIFAYIFRKSSWKTSIEMKISYSEHEEVITFDLKYGLPLVCASVFPSVCLSFVNVSYAIVNKRDN